MLSSVYLNLSLKQIFCSKCVQPGFELLKTVEFPQAVAEAPWLTALDALDLQDQARITSSHWIKNQKLYNSSYTIKNQKITAWKT